MRKAGNDVNICQFHSAQVDPLFFRTFAFTALIFLTAPVMAQNVEQARPSDLVQSWFFSKIQSAEAVASIRHRFLERFESLDPDGLGVTNADNTEHGRRTRAQRRSQMIANWMKYDLDGDQRISRAEIERFLLPEARAPLRSSVGSVAPTPEQVQATLDVLVKRVDLPDLDGDGFSTLEEMQEKALSDHPAILAPTPNGRWPIPLALDRNGDLVVSREEYVAGFEGLLESLDADADGYVSQAEISAFRVAFKAASKRIRDSRQEQARLRRVLNEARECDFPDLPRSAILSVLSLYEGAALANVTLSTDAELTTVADIFIEPGTRPIYLMAGAYRQTILRFSGSTDRIVQVIAESDRVAVFGLPKNKVHFYNRPKCYLTLWAGHVKANTMTRRVIERGFGRPIDQHVDLVEVGLLNLPSGTPRNRYVAPGARRLPLVGPGARSWQTFLRFHPSGLVDLPAGRVISASPVRKYELLPQAAGLAQLVEAGQLEHLPKSDVAVPLKLNADGSIKIGKKVFYMDGRLGDDVLTLDGFRYTRDPDGVWRGRLQERYRVLGPMRYPAELTAAHAVVFEVPPGVPMPQGFEGDSVVVQVEN